MMFWEELKGKTYIPPEPENKKRKKQEPLNLEVFGILDSPYALTPADDQGLNEITADPVQNDIHAPQPETTQPETLEATETTEIEEVKAPKRLMPTANDVYHFHPIAFINHMKLVFGEQTGECHCNRDLTTEEFKNIFIQVRKSEKLGKGILNHSNCAIPSNDKTFERLTEEFNKTTRKYGINQCIQKIHFISQIYWESARFTTGLEFADGTGYNPGQHRDAAKMGHTVAGDGPKYKGRGFMQLTWRKSQIEYLKYAAKKEGTLKGKTDTELELRSNNYEKYISDNLFYAMDSAGWFWSNYKKAGSKYSELKGKPLNDIALHGDTYINYISTLVNGGGSGKSERKKYYGILKNIFKYDFVCVNNENKQELESSDFAPWVKYIYQEFAEYKGLNEVESPLKERIIEYHKPGRKSGDHSISWCASFVY
ncbi:hypothetical protein KO500_13645 [Cellulophaga baltica]|uniref:hypothetical protein n=1 Tax=Cellulophaga TaxID=104264 RepID=UPI001C069EE6|nr:MULTISPECIES: hypothetical protein [Cellulophaga]MBU2997487.1 hypothetical protein [Cellulophaga baltica]MDO6768883.1 hypothetical protein [Cellulophaga sp. 1_MG-2023]